MKQRAIMVVSFVSGLLAGGCAGTDPRVAEEYQTRANAMLRDHDARVELAKQVRAQHRALDDRYREAMMQQRKIVGAKFLGTVEYGEPPGWTKLWVALVISEDGRVIANYCRPDGNAEPLNPVHEKLIAGVVTHWRFSPLTIDGVPAESVNIFPAFTNGTEFRVSQPRELR